MNMMWKTFEGDDDDDDDDDCNNCNNCIDDFGDEMRILLLLGLTVSGVSVCVIMIYLQIWIQLYNGKLGVWVGGSPYTRDFYLRFYLESQTTGPQTTNFISWYMMSIFYKIYAFIHIIYIYIWYVYVYILWVCCFSFETCDGIVHCFLVFPYWRLVSLFWSIRQRKTMHEKWGIPIQNLARMPVTTWMTLHVWVRGVLTINIGDRLDARMPTTIMTLFW